MTDKVKQLTGKPGRPKGVEIQGSKVSDEGPEILDGRRGKGGVEIKEPRKTDGD